MSKQVIFFANKKPKIYGSKFNRKNNFGSRSRTGGGDFDYYRKRYRHGRFSESARDDVQRRRPEWVIIAWVAAGILSLAGALTYAELSAMKPRSGRRIVFLRDAYGRVWSFLYGWMLIFVGKTGAQASVAVAFAIGLNDFLGGKLKADFVEQRNIFGYSV